MIHDKIRELREKTGMSARKFADKFGLKYTTYYGYETGAREPGSEFLIKFSQYFNVTVDYLLGIEKSSNTTKTNLNYENAIDTVQQQYGKSAADALHLYTQLDVEDQGEIRGEMKQMLKQDKYANQEESKNA